MENWTWRPEVLARFAFHHRTGEPLPAELLDRLAGAKLLNIAISKLRQASFGLLDMALHGPGPDKDIDEILAATTEVSLFPLPEGTFSPASFGHLDGRVRRRVLRGICGRRCSGTTCGGVSRRRG